MTGRLAPLISITTRIKHVVNGGSAYYVDTAIARNRRPGAGDTATRRHRRDQRPPNSARHSMRSRACGCWILLIGLIGIAVAAALAAFVATAVLRPVRRLSAAAETVAATGEPRRTRVHRGWRRARATGERDSTPCSRRSRNRSAGSAASSPTRRTSCARRSRRRARTSTSSARGSCRKRRYGTRWTRPPSSSTR